MFKVVFFTLLAAAVADTDKPHVYQPATDLLWELEHYGRIGTNGGSSRIINGKDSDIRNHPWQISLRLSGSHICGGSILSETTILTAAHCLTRSVSSYTIMAGSTLQSTTGTTGQVRSVSRLIIHESYNQPPAGFSNDIALLVLSEPLYLDNINVKAISLPTANFNPTSSNNCTMSGWGRHTKNSELPDRLQEAQVNPITNSQCIERMKSISGATIYDHHICPYNGASTSCNGDSGGPYVCLNGFEYVLTGVTSWGIQSHDNRCLTTYPAVYVRVTEFLNWINTNMQ